MRDLLLYWFPIKVVTAAANASIVSLDGVRRVQWYMRFGVIEMSRDERQSVFRGHSETEAR